VDSSIHLARTQLSGELRMVGPGFYSLGAPNLRNDCRSYQVRLQQDFLGGEGRLSTHVRRSRDNLIGWKSATTKTVAWGVSGHLRPRHWPFLQINLAPHSQTYDGDTLRTEVKTTLFSAAAGHEHGWGAVRLVSQLNYVYQRSRTQTDTTRGDAGEWTSHLLGLSQTARLPIPLTVSCGVTFSERESAGGETRGLSLDCHGSYPLWRGSPGTLGLTVSGEGDGLRKMRIYLRSVLAPWTQTEVDVRAEQGFYRDRSQPVNDYDEFILKVRVTRRW
jgi:hypothetical protein